MVKNDIFNVLKRWSCRSINGLNDLNLTLGLSLKQKSIKVFTSTKKTN